ncbi:MAG: transcriptional regulator [Sphaerospermopsis sp. SIO1G2]|nr:transcriptional regulator [Sphaerospermopsis sp. SIO1G1]NET72078.1 transcriptional regulator [Sphaerospermopsis sp. SIO1G2]
MNTDSQFDDLSHSQSPNYLSDQKLDGKEVMRATNTNELTGTKDMEKHNFLQHNEVDRFELLSAYLDGEVTAVERRQVEEWLETDESVKCLYARLLKLRQCVKTMPVPVCEQTPEATFQQVWQRLQHRTRLGWMIGGAAVAACVVSAVSSFLPSSTPRLQLAQKTVEPTVVNTEPAFAVSPLMVTLNNPVVEIPKTAIAVPEEVVEQSQNLEPGIGLDIN